MLLWLPNPWLLLNMEASEASEAQEFHLRAANLLYVSVSMGPLKPAESLKPASWLLYLPHTDSE